MQMIKVGSSAVMMVQFIRVCKNVPSEYTLDLVTDKLHDAAEAGSRVLLELGPLLSGRLCSLRCPHDVHLGSSSSLYLTLVGTDDFEAGRLLLRWLDRLTTRHHAPTQPRLLLLRLRRIVGSDVSRLWCCVVGD